MQPKKQCQDPGGCANKPIARGLCTLHYSRLQASPEFTPIIAPKGSSLAFLEGLVGHKGNDCVRWPYSRNKQGYGWAWVGGKTVSAHRMMCEMAHGSPPPAADASHSCGKGYEGCVNPQHLRWATRKENIRDQFVHGTFQLGERHHNHKLTADQVSRIFRDERTLLEIAKDFGCCKSTVSHIKTGRLWSHLTGKVLVPKLKQTP